MPLQLVKLPGKPKDGKCELNDDEDGCNKDPCTMKGAFMVKNTSPTRTVTYRLNGGAANDLAPGDSKTFSAAGDEIECGSDLEITFSVISYNGVDISTKTFSWECSACNYAQPPN